MRWSHAAASLALALTVGACVFELGDVVVISGGAGGGGMGGAGGSTSELSHEVVIDVSGVTMTGTQQDVPVLVALDATRIDYGVTQPQGQDLRFYSSDGQTELAHEIERWDTSGTSIVWVGLPLLDANATRFLMRFGDPKLADGQRAEDVWSAYVAVYHMADDLSQGALVRDSSANGHHGTASNVQADPNGFVGQAMAFDGSSSEIDVGDTLAFEVAPGEGRSLEVMFRRDTNNDQSMAVMQTKNSCCGGWSFLLLGDQFANMRQDMTTGDCCQNNFGISYVGPTGLPGGGSNNTGWNHIVSTMDRAAGSGTIYHDDTALETAPLPTTGVSEGGDVSIGVSWDGADTWLGLLDELRVGARAFDAEWVSVQYASLNDTLLSYGPITER